MLKRLSITVAALAAVVLFVFWFIANKPTTAGQTNQKLQVVATNSILADMAEHIVGDRGHVHSIVPRGQDPHEYEPKPSDAQATAQADVLFHNGLKLETGGNGWFTKLVKNAGKTFDREVFSASAGVKSRLVADDPNSPDPHAWLDVQNGIKYIQNMTKAIVAADPTHAKTYQANAAAYIKQLTALDQQARTQFQDIPADRRYLVTSEGAFQYFGAAYGIKPVFIWAINTESQGTPEQLRQVLEQIRTSQVPVLFVETSVSKKAMNKVAQESGKPIYSTLFTDSLGKKGQAGDTYYKMMAWNLKQIHAGLSQGDH